jgi:Protein of unknown function (DUF3551)
MRGDWAAKGRRSGRFVEWRVSKMKSISKMITASAAALSTLVLVAIAAPAAHAGEFCNTNTSGMRGCGYSNLEQCQATISSTGGNCARDPFYSDTKNALAYQPKHLRARSELRTAK